MPTLTAFSPSEWGPFVGAPQSGFEQTEATRSHSFRMVSCVKSCRSSLMPETYTGRIVRDRRLTTLGREPAPVGAADSSALESNQVADARPAQRDDADRAPGHVP